MARADRFDLSALIFAKGQAMSGPKRVKSFRSGRNQAVRIPVEFELPSHEAIMHCNGKRLIIEPLKKRGLLALLKTMEAVNEDFPEITDPAPILKRVF
jgi:antitoxin VapB